MAHRYESGVPRPVYGRTGRGHSGGWHRACWDGWRRRRHRALGPGALSHLVRHALVDGRQCAAVSLAVVTLTDERMRGVRMERTLFVLGATGFIGREVVAEAVAAGWQVRALTRSDAGTQAVQEAGGLPIRGGARQPDGWIAPARGATALVDLLRPRFPRRLMRAAVQRISAERQALTRDLVAALQGLPAGER